MRRIQARVVVSVVGVSLVMLFLTNNVSITRAPPNHSTVMCNSNTDDAVIPKDTNIHLHHTSNSTLFPKRLISIFGLEKSGTTFTSLTIAKALGIVPEHKLRFPYSAEKNGIQVQHISQPWGYFRPQPVSWSCKPQNLAKTKTIFAAVPLNCARHPMLAKKAENATFPRQCKEEALLDDFVEISSRFFVNITSHILWYLERGVDATAVVLMRDRSIAHLSKTATICKNANVSRAQNEYANSITQEAIQKLDPSRIVLVSFEGMVSLGLPYLQDIFRQLRIQNSTHVPNFLDANEKYIRTKGST
jgi:hypothetical protein